MTLDPKKKKKPSLHAQSACDGANSSIYTRESDLILVILKNSTCYWTQITTTIIIAKPTQIAWKMNIKFMWVKFEKWISNSCK